MRVAATLITFSSLLFSHYSYGQKNIKLAERIDSLYAVDQSSQLQVKTALENKIALDSIMKLQAAERQIFERHIPLLKEIITYNGYPTIKKVGAGASTHFFTLIQHSDSDPVFQASMLPVLKKLSKKGEVSKKDYAFLYDRVQRNTGKKQLYGTQLSFDSNGNLFDSTNKIRIPTDLADPKNVDRRRRKMTLEPLEQYYESVLEMLGRPRKKISSDQDL
jgi:hypothetical protein